MGYKLYRSEELAHAAKGSSWSNHKYINKFFKNGKWVYVYNPVKNSPMSNASQNQYRKTDEYYKGENGKMVHYTVKTRNGKNWLSSSIQVRSGNDVTVYKDNGRIAQGIEKSASKGKSFIEKLAKKRRKTKSKDNSRIKVTSHNTTLG